MKKLGFKNVRFCTTAVSAKGYPTIKLDSGKLMPEVAIAGRSNVGKSTLLNHLFNVKGLVKTSSTPGKTQALNFFLTDDQVAFVDLPGYGYAKVPDSVRKRWGPLVQEYLMKREQLKLVLFLIDIRRIPNEDDKKFLSWLSYYGKSVILVLTKTDKVSNQEKIINTGLILKAFNSENLHYTYYSSPKNIGRHELSRMILDALSEVEEEAL